MKKITELKINIESILQAKKLFDVIGHEVRAGIIKFIHEKEEVYISEVNLEFSNIEKANISRHIKMLSNAGIVNTREQGRQTFCTINNARLQSILEAVSILELKHTGI